MPTIEPDDVYRAARTLLPSLDAVTGKALQELLDQADRGSKVDNSIIDLLTQDPDIRRKLREILFPQDESLMRGYQPLGGNVSSPSVRKYVCPVADCGMVWRPQNVGEQIKKCPDHNVLLIPDSQKKKR